GKRPIVLKRFITGYIANRLQSALALEVYALLDAGVASAQEIDDAIRHGFAARLALFGHLQRADLAGLAFAQQTLANGTYRPPEPKGRSEAIDRLVAEGRTGVM